jgi:hypothetical protein
MTMGLARDLSMGPRRRRPRIATTGDYAIVRRALADPEPDPAALRDALERIAASPHRLRPAEGRVYLDGCARYRDVTGEDYGPRRGEY